MGYSDRIAEVKSEIDALITYSNEKTGKEDSTMGDVVQSLIDGYGIGIMQPYIDESGSFTLDEDFTSTTYTTVYDLVPETTVYNEILTTINTQEGKSIIVCNLTSDVLTTSLNSLAICGNGASGTNKPPLANLTYYSTVDTDNVTTSSTGSALGVSPYLQYGRLLRVSGKCSTSSPSAPAGTYNVRFRVYASPF